MTALAAPEPPAATPPVVNTRREVACAHCSLPVPSGQLAPDAEQQFCCAGCASVYRMIHGCGLDRYYQLREALNTDPLGPVDLAPDRSRYGVFDDPAFLEAHTRGLPDGLVHADLRLANVHCAACVWLIERLPRVCPGVVEARLSLRQTVARVTWDPQQTPLSRIASALHGLGYPPYPAGASDTRSVRLAGERKMLVRIGIAGACAGNAMLLALAMYLGLLDRMAEQYETFLRWVSLLIGAVALAGPGAVFFRGAWAGLRTRRVTLDLPIALALGVGGLAGLLNVAVGRGEVYFDSLCVLIFLLLVGRYLQMCQQRRMTDAVTLMQSLSPIRCEVRRGGRWIELPREALEPGDRVRVPSNERLPADGEVVRGETSLDTSSLTGESQPARVGVGDDVFAGTQNVGPAIEFTVTATGAQTRLSRLMEDAAAGVAAKPGIVAFADRIAGYFTLTVVALAAAVLSGWWWAVDLETGVQHAVALLIVACPCALGLATPLTLALGVGIAARRDIMVKDAAVFEKLAAVGRDRPGLIALDKTGTLTNGEPRVVGWVGDTGIQALVGRAERDARHPAGRALRLAYDPGDGEPFAGVVEDPRGGLTAPTPRGLLRAGNARYLANAGVGVTDIWLERAETFIRRDASVVWIALDQKIVAAAALRDAVRDESARVVRDLIDAGWRPTILSGDIDATVRRVANELGLPPIDAHANLTPEAKRELVEQYREQSGTVLMVGDGVNDAAALASADTGLAVHGGAEAAMTVADAYTARPGLTPVTELIRLGRFTVRVIRQNLFISLSYNALAVTLAGAGVLSPWIAAILMPVSSLTVLSLAAARLGRWKGAEACR